MFLKARCSRRRSDEGQRPAIDAGSGAHLWAEHPTRRAPSQTQDAIVAHQRTPSTFNSPGEAARSNGRPGQRDAEDLALQCVGADGRAGFIGKGDFVALCEQALTIV
jgi:hypothetical protein